MVEAPPHCHLAIPLRIGMKRLGVTPRQGVDRMQPNLYKSHCLAIAYLNNRIIRRKDTRTDIMWENRKSPVSVKCSSEWKSARSCPGFGPRYRQT